jgi:hypothetical protein
MTYTEYLEKSIATLKADRIDEPHYYFQTGSDRNAEFDNFDVAAAADDDVFGCRILDFKSIDPDDG